MKLLAGTSNPTLAQAIAKQMGLHLIDAEITEFANGEKRVWIKESVQGENVILVQSLSQPTNEHLMESLLLIDALERMGVRHINFVMPWMGYSFQDKVFRPGEPIAAKVVADVISNSYVKRVFLFDLHNTSIPGFFSIPSHHLNASSLFVAHARQQFDLSQTVVASPDFGGLKRASVFAETLGVELIKLDKRRDFTTGEIIDMNLHGDVRNKIVLVYDDSIMAGGTASEAAETLKKAGAREIHFMATHGLFVGTARERLSADLFNSIVVTNSVYHAELPAHVKVIDSSPLFAAELSAWT